MPGLYTLLKYCVYFVVCPSLSSQGTDIYLAFSAFTSRPISFLAADKTFVFFYGVVVFPIIWTSSN